MPTFTASELDLEATYSSKLLGQTTQRTPVTGEELLTVNSTFTFQCDVLSPADVDMLISNPVLCKWIHKNYNVFYTCLVLVTITEHPAAVDLNLLNELAKGSEKPTYNLKKLSVSSATEIAKSFEVKPETATAATQKDSAGSSRGGPATPKKKDSKTGAENCQLF